MKKTNISEKRNILRSIFQGNYEEAKRLKRLKEPQIIFIRAPRNGKYFTLSGNKERKKWRISLAEIEEMKKDYTVFFLTRAEHSIFAGVCTSEEEVTKRMEEEEGLGVRK